MDFMLSDLHGASASIFQLNFEPRRHPGAIDPPPQCAHGGEPGTRSRQHAQADSVENITIAPANWKINRPTG
jgi:hypothetical protein